MIPILYEVKYEELLRDILDEPVLPIPPIGPNPFKNIKEFAKQKFIPSTEKYISPATKGYVTLTIQIIMDDSLLDRKN